MAPPVRMVLLALAILGLTGSLLQYRAWAGEQSRMDRLLARADLAEEIPGLAERVRRAATPIDARLRATRPVVAFYLDPTWLFAVPEADRREVWDRSLATLEEVRATASRAMRARPTSWEAPMVLGASTYMLHRAEGAATTEARMEEWERPLRRAEALIPGYLEPTLFLAVAYVNHWQSLSAASRGQARETLAVAFRDPTTFRLVSDLWLRLVPDRKEALSIIPDEPYAWDKLQRFFARSGEWRLYVDARKRYRTAHRRYLDHLVSSAERKIAGGDVRLARMDYHKAAARTPPDEAHLDLLRRVLTGMPPGPVEQHAERNLASWLEWALPLCLIDRCPLSANELERLVGLVADPDPADRASVALLAGRPDEAERLERGVEDRVGGAWNRYLLFKASDLVERGDRGAAAQVLAAVDGDWRRHPTYRALAGASSRGDPDLVGTSTWGMADLRADGSSLSLELLAARPADGFAITIGRLPRAAVPVDVFWNGRLVETSVFRPGSVAHVAAEISTEPSLLLLRPLSRIDVPVESLVLDP